MDKPAINTIFEKIAETLDISEEAFAKAESRYQNIGKWLNRTDSKIRHKSPNIYPQGSINLGTIIKPINEVDEYDFDLVCEINYLKNEITQEKLKELVGNEIRDYINAYKLKNPIKEGNRCWTLQYEDNINFHIDILPCVPDSHNFKLLLEKRGFKNVNFSDTAIAITDKNNPQYKNISLDWNFSNPKGYLSWFKDCMKKEFERKRNLLAEKMHKSFEKVPEYKVKTTLQQTIQILKRHRDIMFCNDSTNKPISIIITTLGAMCYTGESNLYDALMNILHNMSSKIQIENGHYIIFNPVDPRENFADKWKNNQDKSRRFFEWLDKARNDFSNFVKTEDVEILFESAQPILGEQLIKKSFNNYKEEFSKSVGLVPANTVTHTINLPQRQKLQYPISLNGNVYVTAKSIYDGYRSRDLVSGGFPIKKDVSLRFIATTNITRPFTVLWQVVNTGAEARRLNQLRGGFYEGDIGSYGLERQESTKYRGTHFVECFIIKNKLCVARSGEFIVNIM
jgi:hypothetical protein